MASVTCGHCHRTHSSVAEVRSCAGYPSAVTTAPIPEERRKPQPVCEGFYFLNEAYHKVQMNREGTRAYAKTLQFDAEKDKWRWFYSPGLVMELRPENRLTAEQAAKFGKLYEVCCCCAQRLTHEQSIAVGYGPTCADNNGWPWGEE